MKMSLNEPSTAMKRPGHVRNLSNSGISQAKDKKFEKKSSYHGQAGASKEPSESDESEEDWNDSDQVSSDDSQSARLPTTSGRTTKDPSGKGSSKQRDEWEIMAGLKDGQQVEQMPERRGGFLLKRRKWPMKGWHKRYFVIDKGILTYAKNPGDFQKGKFNGTVDIGLSVLTYKKDGKRIDIDAEDLIYHLKSKDWKTFSEWIMTLQKHRLYRQFEIAYGTRDAPKMTGVKTPVDDFSTPLTSPLPQETKFPDFYQAGGGLGGPGLKTRLVDGNQSKIMAWLMDVDGMEQTSHDLATAQAKIFELGTLLDTLKGNLPPHSTSLSENAMALTNHHHYHHHERLAPGSDFIKNLREIPWELPVKRRGLRFRHKKSHEHLAPIQTVNGHLSPSEPVTNGVNLHTSVSSPNFLPEARSRVRPVSVPEAPVLVTLERDTTSSFLHPNPPTHHPAGKSVPHPDETVKEEFLRTATDVLNNFKHVLHALNTERERLRQAIKAGTQPNSHYAVTLLGEAGPDLDRLKRQASLLRDERAMSPQDLANWDKTSSSVEFYDANDTFCSASDQSSDDDEDASDLSDTDNALNQTSVLDDPEEEVLNLTRHRSLTGRRYKLPAPKPTNANISLFGLLRKNIGRDLSKVSMPVSMNEPLSMLQRLCEELEYSDLLDKANSEEDQYMRMVLVTAFAVSPFAATFHRAGQKPFNPLLGETYECVREDKGWRFVAEQVSHHPPISACYCESKNFTFWQDVQIKSKFWGKSMEVLPSGQIHLKLPKFKEHYVWNKPTTCIHNIMGGSRWMDHYGEVNITNTSSGVKCKLTFVKSSYWSDTKHEVYGTVFSPEGRAVHELYGKWNEGLYYGHCPSARCIWRPGTMPENYDQYYGFTRFALELNEIEDEQRGIYCSTDSRFRPDQRALEEGNIDKAESEKHRLESMQRERSKKNEQVQPRWFMKTNDSSLGAFMYNGKYWEIRRDPGFKSITYKSLW